MPEDAVPPGDDPTQPRPPAQEDPPTEPRPPAYDEPRTGPRAPAYDEPPPAPPWPPAPPGPPPSDPGRRSLGQLLVGALVGGLVGALVASGAWFAFGRDDTSTTTVKPAQKTNEVARESSTIGRNGDIAGIIAKVEPAVFAVTVDQGGRQSAGTGFVISADGFAVTNAHVVENAQQVKTQFNDGRSVDARVVGRDPSADVAVLKLNGTGLPVACLADSNKVQVGDDVVAIGNALALEGGLSVTRGIISGPPRPGAEIGTAIESVLQTDAAINPGNSGGPLVDANGCVIGINTAVASGSATQPAQNVGFAIPISLAKTVVDDIEAGRKPAFLGVGTTDLTPELKSQVDVNVDAGAVVDSISSGSPADDAGIQRGDVIVQIGDEQVKNGGGVATAVRKHHPGDKVSVVFVRGSDRKTVEVTLTERSDVG
ncbi:MAG TPA: trypsin-like peptidase domain-containing protein [Acidimicrobiia bacterium]|nr:trypsin-like peptidase domain-containing protein [Acidimicrobiia bacterium]